MDGAGAVMLRSDEADVLTFDPCEVQRLWEQDALYEDYGYLVDMTWQWTSTGPFAPRVTLAFDGDSAGLEAASRAATLLASRPRYRGNDDEFARYLRALRMAVSFPLNGMLVSRVRLVLDVAEEERDYRVKQRKLAATFRPDDWTPEMFRAEVEALCGTGHPAGAEVVYKCPWHDDEHPSLYVNYEKRAWICRSQCGGGGHREWRARSKGSGTDGLRAGASSIPGRGR